MKRRAVVTGLAAITPLGTGVETNWQSLCQGKSGIGAITRFDTTRLRIRIAGEVTDFNPYNFIDRKLLRRTDRFVHFALAASMIAMEDSQLEVNSRNSERIGVSLGTALGGIQSLEKNHRLLLEGKQISPFFIPCFLANMAAGNISVQFGTKGPNICPVAACASGAQAIGDAFRIIQSGEADVMIAGGAEANISPLMFAGLDAMKVASSKNEEPEKASRPFERDRDGFVTSEGSGIMILEELEFALNRGARIYSEILGYGLSSDAWHIVAPDPDGKGAAACIRHALSDSGVASDKIDYINAHGTSTKLNDRSETRAIKSVFGKHAHEIAISSNKSMIGHLWGAAGSVEAVFSILTIDKGIIPPTINYDNPDPECDLDYVPNTARRAEVRVVLSNSFGFGGINATLVFSKFPG